MDWRSRRINAVAILLAATVIGELVVLGANGPLLAAGAAVAQIMVAIVALVLLAPEAGFWRGAAPALACVGVAIGWASLPGIVPAGLWPAGARAAVAARITPDLFLPAMARMSGTAALLVAAGALGYRRGLARICIDWLILFGLVQILVGLVLRSMDPDRVWGFGKTINVGRYTGTLINSNANACAAGVLALLAFARTQALLRAGAPATLRGTLMYAACGLVVIASIGTCAISGSRTVLSLAILGLVGLTLADRVWRRWLVSPRGALALVVALVVIGTMLLVVGDATLDRFQLLGADSLSRAHILRHYAALAAEAPLFGYGIGGFGEANTALLRTLDDARTFWYINAAHNEPIMLVMEGGLVHAILVLVAVAVLAVTALRHGRRHDDDPVIRAVPVALLLIAAESTIDIALDVPALMALATLLLGMIWGRSLRSRAGRDKKTMPPRLSSSPR